jgi:uncharacterized protein (TIGR04141 family)
MADEPTKAIKYSIHLARPEIKTLEAFLSENAAASAKEIRPRPDFPLDARLFYSPRPPAPPSWAKLLDNYLAIDGAIKTSSVSAALLFKHNNRIFACTYGFGHTLLDADKRENEFGLLIAANALSDSNVKLVEKANLGSVIRDATQAAGITKLSEFNVDRALSLVRKLSGNSEKVGSSLSGAASITLTSNFEPYDLPKLADILLQLFQDTAYQKTGFGIIDKIKPVRDIILIDELDQALIGDLNNAIPSFELGLPEISTEPMGRISLTGTGLQTNFADLNLATALAVIGQPDSAEDLHKHKVRVHSIDDKYIVKEWSVYRGLVGSLDIGNDRYALNEGTWYKVDELLIKSANESFDKTSRGLDKTFGAWPVIIKKEKGKAKKSHYQAEYEYNKEMSGKIEDLYLFDTDLFQIPGVPGPGVEVCDLINLKDRRIIHVKRSGRRSSIISHFLNQGANSARLLKTYPLIKNDLFDKLRTKAEKEIVDEAEKQFPEDWTIEYKFADKPNTKEQYTIPFFSRVSLDETRREILALGFKAVEISFIRLSGDSAATTPKG